MGRTQVASNWITKAVPVVNAKTKVSEVRKMVEKRSDSFEIIDYVYVLDDDGTLIGWVSIKELMGEKKSRVEIRRLIKEKCITVHPHTHQEKVAYIALSRGLRSVPVVDKDNRFLGVVPYDAILKIFNHEVHEDFLKFGGIFHRVGKEFTTIYSPALVMIKARLPWLLLGTIGGMVAAYVVEGFESLIKNFVALAAFVPLLVYMSDAVGTQSETIIIRSMAIDPNFSPRQYFIREIKIAFAFGLFCGTLVGAMAGLGWGNPVLGIIVGVSLFISMFASVCIATLLPFGLKKLNIDPAMSAGPFATILSDITTVFIYFTVATFFIKKFGVLG